jgi:CYTH domain-containing protein
MNKNMIEIERKFLVKEDAKMELTTMTPLANCLSIDQGYLTKNDKGSVRVRIEETLYGGSLEKNAFLMSKTKIDDMTNNETVDEISIPNAELLLKNFSSKIISKTRYIKIVDGFKWEIDFFHTPNAGLVIAEIELTSADQKFTIPDWIDREVTGQSEYYNANM